MGAGVGQENRNGVKLFEKRLKQMLHSAGVTMSCRVCIINQTGPRYEFIRVLQNSNTIKEMLEQIFHNTE